MPDPLDTTALEMELRKACTLGLGYKGGCDSTRLKASEHCSPCRAANALKALRERIEKLEVGLRSAQDLVYEVQRGRKASVGGLYNTYVPQVEVTLVDGVGQQLAALAAPAPQPAHQEVQVKRDSRGNPCPAWCKVEQKDVPHAHEGGRSE